MDLLKKLAYFFTKEEKLKASLLFGMMMLGGISEAIGIGLIVPYISLINNPDIIEKNKKLARLYSSYNFGTHENFIFWCGILFFVIYMTKNLFTYFLMRAQNKFIYGKEVSLSRSLLQAYLRQPYTFHLQKNSAELINNLAQASRMFQGVLIPIFTILIESIVVFSIAIILLIARPVPAILAGVVLGGMTVGFYQMIRKSVRKAGLDQKNNGEMMIRWLSQSLGGIKETKILGRESFFVDYFTKHVRGYVDATGFIQIASQMPRLVLEVMSIFGIVFAVCYTQLQGKSLPDLVPTLGLFGLAVVRLTPSLNRILSNLAVIRACKSAVDTVYGDLIEFPDLIVGQNHVIKEAKIQPMILRNSIEIKNLFYKYPDTQEFALNGVSINIPKGSSVALIGTSGAGKSTMVDLILGLLDPTSGEITIDGLELSKIKAPWQRSVGYIPQTIYLTDDSIRGNIAFGVPAGEIDDAKVWKALAAAQLDTFVKSLPKLLDTFVGERGVRISGGQRQRIGIARALYYDPEILILDEATSALDNATEKEVSMAINSFSGKKTMIVIAHRLTTAEKCDQIFKLSHGKVVAQGTFLEVCAEL
jgi:ABC-type multidrug transport system fused ATPase/permease subunit